jgi:cobalamin biosynthesis Mg chelatase CobN
MPDSDRLNHLRRQRALLQEHLAWLEAEITAETARGAAERPASKAPVAETASKTEAEDIARGGSLDPDREVRAATAAGSTSHAAAEDARDDNADQILEHYRSSPQNLQQDVRRGCLVYFIVALVLLAAGVVGLYYALRRH